MKLYSEDELKKWLGHSITYPLLEQMESIEMRQCEGCRFWEEKQNSWGYCNLILFEDNIKTLTYKNTLCKRGFVG